MKISKMVLLIAGFAAAGFLTNPLAGIANAAEAKVIFTEGRVQARNNPSDAWRELQKDDALPEGAEITTGPDASCELAVGGEQKSVIKLTPNSNSKLTSLEPVKIDLPLGKLYALVRGLKQGSTFQVMTPTAVASARGTGFSHDASAVEVFEDTVDVEGSAGGDPPVSEGNGIHVNPDGTLGDEYDLSDESEEEWDEFKKDAEESLDGEGDGEEEKDLEELDEATQDAAEAEDQKDIDEAMEEEEKDDRGGQTTEQFIFNGKTGPQ